MSGADQLDAGKKTHLGALLGAKGGHDRGGPDRTSDQKPISRGNVSVHAHSHVVTHTDDNNDEYFPASRPKTSRKCQIPEHINGQKTPSKGPENAHVHGTFIEGKSAAIESGVVTKSSATEHHWPVTSYGYNGANQGATGQNFPAGKSARISGLKIREQLTARAATSQGTRSQPVYATDHALLKGEASQSHTANVTQTSSVQTLLDVKRPKTARSLEFSREIDSRRSVSVLGVTGEMDAARIKHKISFDDALKGPEPKYVRCVRVHVICVWFE
jgi:hypothetical protein